jgi:uncharacterized membrane protein
MSRVRKSSSGMAIPLLATAGASAACLALYSLRVLWTGNWGHLFLVWNLVLAWLPLALALAAKSAAGRWPDRRGWVIACSLAWLCFFPNAPYIVTDLVHLAWRRPPVFWVDLTLILSFALTGLFLGFLSLYVMQSLVARRFGWVVGWIFVTGSAVLAGLGMYIGRFLRWNSWDALLNPVDLARDLAGRTGQLTTDLRPAVVAAMFGVFVWLTYVLLYALTHLRPVEAEAADP